MTTPVWLILGSNIDPFHNMEKALVYLQKHAKLVAKSHLYATEPTVKRSNRQYLNMAVKILTEQDYQHFKEQVIQAVEAHCQRVRTQDKYAPRTIDVDICFWGEQLFQTSDIQIPDDEVAQFRYMLMPLNDISPDFVHPVAQKTVATLLAECQDGLQIERLAWCFDE